MTAGYRRGWIVAPRREAGTRPRGGRALVGVFAGRVAAERRRAGVEAATGVCYHTYEALLVAGMPDDEDEKEERQS